MLTRHLTILILLTAFTASGSYAQSPSNLDNKILFRKEWSVYAQVHTGGWGLGYRQGRHKTGFRKQMWEVEFVSMKHPKEKKITSLYENTRSFIYGKMNYFYMLRGAYGMQRIVNSKPYWGGIELRWFLYGGVTLGITKPVYLYILKWNEEKKDWDRVTERYDPDKHGVEDIYGRGSYFKGFDRIQLYPGAYAKTGLNFEFGTSDEFLKSLECGVNFDFFPLALKYGGQEKPIQEIKIMAFNPGQWSFLSLYLSLHFGKRKN